MIQENLFKDVTVTPRYGFLKITVRWTLAGVYKNAVFIVRRSATGTGDWIDVGVPTTTDFVEDALVAGDKVQEYYYQVEMRWNGQSFFSPPVATFGKASRQEFGMAYQIMNLEYRQLQKHLPIKFFSLKIFGPQCPDCVDPDTEQRLATTLCETCFGTAIEGGYVTPGLETFMRVLQESSKVQVDSGDGSGAEDPVRVKVRLLSYPVLHIDDMVIVPDDDRRYLVEEVSLGKLNGRIPVTQDATLLLLRRNDIHYKFPI